MVRIERVNTSKAVPLNVYPLGNTRPIHSIRRYSYDYLLFSMVLFLNGVNSLAPIKNPEQIQARHSGSGR